MAVAKGKREWNEDCSVGDRRGQIYASLPFSDWSSEIILFQSGLTNWVLIDRQSFPSTARLLC